MKLVYSLLLAACTVAHAQTAPPATQLAPGVWLLRGTFPEGRLPDGNTLLFEGTKGFVVMDTGRHAWHSDAILAFAQGRNRPVTGIVNTHWHLDHTSGNIPIKRAHPAAKVYTSRAVERMIADVWPRGIARSEAFLANNNPPPGLAQDVRGDIDTRRDPQALRPDVAISVSGEHDVDGVKLQLRHAPDATTDGDVWVYHPASRIAAVGDLVTLPVPFLDTACVKGWRTALQQVAASPFETVVPGHGAPMTRAQFATYWGAFESFTDCAASARDKNACAADWARATAALRAPEAADDPRTLEMAGEYVDMLRVNGGNAPLCKAP
ncbi:MBL fold metallo-hydrolase [Ramlibacter albus]|uniref:MBL fold metallo-hydrolase n=1 Tax=Ramlibacter albus TaxID=2079448 RepID=A0A923M770_9BURK|nr:MBL fold metallo-hydrolase [Ramlibacter albus]MBC5765507.1 MBL fold metallo-hydrolase [Ramlibacter albus]